jgi:hypothetical protein
MEPQPVHHLVAVLLPHLEVGLRVGRERPPAPSLRVDTQRHLLGHGPRREEQRRVRAEQVGHAAFQHRDRAVRAVGRRVGVDLVEPASQHLLRGTPQRGVQEQ